MTRTLGYLVGVSTLAFVAVPAAAAPYLFTLTGSKNAVFQIDSSRVPDTSSSSFIGSQIAYNNIAGIFGGSPGVASSIGFGTGPILAQLNINGTSLGFAQFGGPDLFSGPVTAPVFNVGTFNLTSIVSGASTLTISNVVTAVPESATWGMLVLGFGAIGFAMRRRGRVVNTSVRFT